MIPTLLHLWQVSHRVAGWYGKGGVVKLGGLALQVQASVEKQHTLITCLRV
jgi:hypothetical protein